MKRIKYTSCILLLSFFILSLGGCNNSTKNDSNVTIQAMEPEFIGVGTFQRRIKDVLNITQMESIYDMKYQEEAQAQIDAQKQQGDYTLEKPLFILNPYGTNRTGLYVYFNTKEATNITYTISVEDEAIPNFTAELFSNTDGGFVTEHEGQIIGLIQGMDNTITFDVLNENGKLIAKTSYAVTVPDFKTLDKLYFNTTIVGDTSKISNGLFTLSDYDLQDAEEYSHILVVDNAGIIRAELILDGKKHAPVMQFINNKLYYAYDSENIASVNRLGKVERIYNLGQYRYHHDMAYNPSNNSIMILADDSKRDTIEEIAISLDLETGEVTLPIDFEVLTPDIYERATRPEQNMMYGSEFDWIHFNSVVFLNDTDVLLSSRELSTIIRVNDVYTNPTITTLIGDALIWENTAYTDLVYSKIGEFSSHAGQHNLTVVHDDTLKDGQYYLTLFNNNWGSSSTWPEFDWSMLKGVNLEQTSKTEGNIGSAFYKYLVDDNNHTFALAEYFELPYASFVSNSSILPNGNISFGSGSVERQFGELTPDGEVIIQFAFDSDSMVGAYRAMKLTYKDFWFN